MAQQLVLNGAIKALDLTEPLIFFHLRVHRQHQHKLWQEHHWHAKQDNLADWSYRGYLRIVELNITGAQNCTVNENTNFSSSLRLRITDSAPLVCTREPRAVTLGLGKTLY